MTVSRDITWKTDEADILSEAEYSIPASEASSVDDENNESQFATSRQVGGAAVAGGLVGLLIAGPVGALVAAGGSAIVATSARGKAGEIARSSGDVVANAGDKLKQVDQKHHVTTRASESISKSCAKIKEFDERHQICAKTKDGLSKSLEKAKEFDKKHRVSAKAASGVVNGCNWLSRQLKESSKKNGQGSSSSTEQNLTS
jgi:hypothetical protein